MHQATDTCTCTCTIRNINAPYSTVHIPKYCHYYTIATVTSCDIRITIVLHSSLRY